MDSKGITIIALRTSWGFDVIDKKGGVEARGPLSFLSCAFKLLTSSLLCQRAFSIWVLAACLSILNWLEHQHCLGGKGYSLSWKRHKCGAYCWVPTIVYPFLGVAGRGGDCSCLYKVTRSPVESRQPLKAKTWTSGLWFGSGICLELALYIFWKLAQNNSEEKWGLSLVSLVLPVVGGPLSSGNPAFPRKAAGLSYNKHWLSSYWVYRDRWASALICHVVWRGKEAVLIWPCARAGARHHIAWHGSRTWWILVFHV